MTGPTIIELDERFAMSLITGQMPWGLGNHRA